jgi:hypothetical protein
MIELNVKKTWSLDEMLQAAALSASSLLLLYGATLYSDAQIRQSTRTNEAGQPVQGFEVYAKRTPLWWLMTLVSLMAVGATVRIALDFSTSQVFDEEEEDTVVPVQTPAPIVVRQQAPVVSQDAALASLDTDPQPVTYTQPPISNFEASYSSYVASPMDDVVENSGIDDVATIYGAFEEATEKPSGVVVLGERDVRNGVISALTTAIADRAIPILISQRESLLQRVPGVVRPHASVASAVKLVGDVLKARHQMSVAELGEQPELWLVIEDYSAVKLSSVLNKQEAAAMDTVLNAIAVSGHSLKVGSVIGATSPTVEALYVKDAPARSALTFWVQGKTALDTLRGNGWMAATEETAELLEDLLEDSRRPEGVFFLQPDTVGLIPTALDITPKQMGAVFGKMWALKNAHPEIGVFGSENERALTLAKKAGLMTDPVATAPVAAPAVTLSPERAAKLRGLTPEQLAEVSTWSVLSPDRPFDLGVLRDRLSWCQSNGLHQDKAIRVIFDVAPGDAAYMTARTHTQQAWAA